MPFESRKRSFYLQVTNKTLILVQISVLPDLQRTKKSEQYKWFTDPYLVKLLEKLNDIALARDLSGEANDGPKHVKEFIQGIDSGFYMMYTFKKKTVKQHILTQTPVVNIRNEECNYSGGGHKELQLFPENIIVHVSLQPIHIGAQPLPLLTAKMAKARKEKSKYFNKHDDGTNGKLTLSAVKKQTNLQTIVSKMKTSATPEQSVTSITDCQQPSSSKHANEPASTSSSLTVNQQNDKQNTFANRKSHEDVSNKLDKSPCSSSMKVLPCEVERQQETGSHTAFLRDKSKCSLNEETGRQSSHADSNSNLSRKRLRKETAGSEGNDSESQCSENNNLVEKRVLSRKKRTKYTHKGDHDNMENREQKICTVTEMNSIHSSNLVDTDFAIKDKSKKDTKSLREMQNTVQIHNDLHEGTNASNHSSVQTVIDDNDKDSTCTESLTNSKNSVCSTSTDEGYSTVSYDELCKSSSSKASDFSEEFESRSQETRDTVVVVDERDDKGCETITIRDVVPSFDDVKEVADLTEDHLEYLIQKIQKKLKNIFKGKEYCRRHEDYKKGGKSRGDLAFQVRFGLYSEDQHDTIMSQLMSVFCARHNKYIDYLSKVLLPETFILIYIEAFGGNHDDVERLLMGQNKKQADITFTDGSSTE